MSSFVEKPRRSALTSVNADGSRHVIHPAKVKGRFTTRKAIAAYLLIVVYALLPWIKVNGFPAVFLDTEQMRFHFVGLTFVSQDLWLAFFLISGLGFGLFYVTALVGRIWCGWACPQTVFLEHVYRRIEVWIEGDAVARRKLDAASLSGEKIAKRGLKHGLFFIVSVAIAHMLMAYFLSVPQLWGMMKGDPAEHWSVFVFIFVFSAALYFNYAFFREQLCIILCPYGRLQSALIDDQSMVIGYDAKRGEPRGKAKESGIGDCIDCNRCVQVCPTGIDIRQGLQMECIGCASCIDACDSIMDRLKRPRGLVRYDSMEGLAGGKTKIIRPRIILYTLLLLLGITVFGVSMSGLSSASLTAWRAPGPSYYLDDMYVRNQYMVRVTNKKNEASFYSLKVEHAYPEGEVRGVDEPFLVEANAEVVRIIVVLIPRELYTGKYDVTIEVVDEKDKSLAERRLGFVGPDPQMLKQENEDGQE